VRAEDTSGDVISGHGGQGVQAQDVCERKTNGGTMPALDLPETETDAAPVSMAEPPQTELEKARSRWLWEMMFDGFTVTDVDGGGYEITRAVEPAVSPPPPPPEVDIEESGEPAEDRTIGNGNGRDYIESPPLDSMPTEDDDPQQRENGGDDYSRGKSKWTDADQTRWEQKVEEDAQIIKQLERTRRSKDTKSHQG
jgi:hypothetical protein